MRRHLSLIAATATLIAGAAIASAASATTPTTPLISATVTACVSGATAAERSADFSAEIQTVPGARTLAVSFSLYQRTTLAGGWVAVSAPGFDVWQDSNAGIGAFTAKENVVDLPAPAAFRAVVHYRWLDRHHRVVRRAERVTPNCVLTLPEPDLFVARLSRAADGAGNGTSFYDVLVRNSGIAVGPFSVALTVGQTAVAPLTVSSLGAGASQAVQFTGPRCTAGTTVTAQIDPSGAIAEPANPDRTVSIVCGAGADNGATGATGSS
jgi:CARDB